MPRMHSVVRGTGTPKDRDEVNRFVVVYYESIKRELKDKTYICLVNTSHETTRKICLFIMNR